MTELHDGWREFTTAAESRKGALLLLLMVLLAYLPVLQWGGTIWDDDSYVAANRNLNDLEGLKQIWFAPRSSPQYYPMTFTGFWLERRFFPVQPFGHHLTNVLLHALNAILLWRILSRLGIQGGWLAAALFALHPVHVESVAWITERKNVLSGFFYLGAFLTYLRFAAASESPSQASFPRKRESRWALWSLSLILFAAALLSKSVTCSLPAALLLVLWWKQGKKGLRHIPWLIPFLLLGAAAGGFTAWLERNHVGAIGSEWSYTFPERCLIAGRALWFYAGKLFWPHPLIFNYPLWKIQVHSLSQWLFPISAPALLALLWLFRRRIGKGPLTAVLFFAVTLFPALGFSNVYPMRYSFVADHFQYLASIGIITLAAAGLGAGFKPAGSTLAFLILLGLGTLTSMQAFIYQNPEILWKDTLAKNQSSWMARCSLGSGLYQAGKRQEALEQFRKAAQLNPSAIEPQVSLAVTLAKMGRGDEALDQSRRLLRQNPGIPMLHIVMGDLLKETGQFEEAALHYAEALRLYPHYSRACNNLGVVLAQQGKLKEAITQFQEARRLSPDSAEIRRNLEIVLAREEAELAR